MEAPIHTDLTGCSFNDFVSFLFARDVPVDPETDDSWSNHAEVVFDPELICDHYIRLFNSPKFLLKQFSKAQLEQGFWVILGPNLNCSAHEIVLDSDLPFDKKEACIASMLNLFKLLFANEPLDGSPHMWWDSFCYDWHCGNRKRERGGEDLLLQDAMFQTLSRILSLDSGTCQAAALHGLGHLHHPDTVNLVARYIQARPSLGKELKEYAVAASQFKIL